MYYVPQYFGLSYYLYVSINVFKKGVIYQKIKPVEWCVEMVPCSMKQSLYKPLFTVESTYVCVSCVSLFSIVIKSASKCD